MLVMLDRDGVLNHDRPDHVRNPGELVMIAGAADAVARLNVAGHKVAVVTNQSGVGQGFITPEMLQRIHEHLNEALARAGAHLDLLLQCTDPPGAPSARRKPAPGMLREALAHFRTAPQEAVMIGDALRDLEAATAAGVKRVLVRTGKGALTQAQGIPGHILPVSVYDDLPKAVDALLSPPR